VEYGTFVLEEFGVGRMDISIYLFFEDFNFILDNLSKATSRLVTYFQTRAKRQKPIREALWAFLHRRLPNVKNGKIN